MRILGMGEHAALGDMYLRLAAEGHEVRVYVDDRDSHDVLAGMIERVDRWEHHLPWVREAGAEGLILFETAGHGALQDRLRADGYLVIGNSAYGTRLEEDRAFGQQVLRDVGMSTLGTWPFTSFDDGIRFLRERPGRYVFKMNGGGFASFRNYVGELEDGEDVIAVLEVTRDTWTHAEPPDFILMEHASGVEMGVGAYFDGREFLRPACLDWEHKRFFPGDLGELTGEMGTLVTYTGADAFLERTLAPLAPRLAHSGYVGYVNLNTIVNARGIWPLEFTTRFGYPGYSILSALHACEWGEVLRMMAAGEGGTFPVRPGYATGVVLTVPSFPYAAEYARLSKGAPVIVRGGALSPAEARRIHWGEVACVNGRIVTAGAVGYVAVVTGAGDTAEASARAAYDLVRRVHVPNVRYRNDIGTRFATTDRARLVEWGMLHDHG